MLTAQADIRTEHAARYLTRLCGHAGKMGGMAGRRLGAPGRKRAGSKLAGLGQMAGLRWIR